MVDIALMAVSAAEKSVLRQLMELYCYDFSEYDGADVNAHGLYGYGYLDHYWTESTRHPFFITVDGKLAGFVLVSDYCYDLAENAHSVSEFFVMRKYRRRGVGEVAAQEVFDRFPGRWVVMQYLSNTPSLRFWERVIGEYTGGHFEKSEKTLVEGNGETWDAQVLIFENGEQ